MIDDLSTVSAAQTRPRRGVASDENSAGQNKRKSDENAFPKMKRTNWLDGTMSSDFGSVEIFVCICNAYKTHTYAMFEKGN